MGIKRLRQNTILELVRSGQIDSQQRLAEELERRGIRVSQSTLSRDIQELGLAKAGNTYTTSISEIRSANEQTLRLVLSEFVDQVDGVHYFLVLKTASGSAPAVAQAVDDAEWPEVVGTIAGENTIFVLCRSEQDVVHLRDRIEDLLE